MPGCAPEGTPGRPALTTALGHTGCTHPPLRTKPPLQAGQGDVHRGPQVSEAEGLLQSGGRGSIPVAFTLPVLQIE